MEIIAMVKGVGEHRKPAAGSGTTGFENMENITAVLVPGVVLPLAAGCVGKEECATSRRRDGCSHSQVPSPSEIPPVPKHTENMDQD